LPRPNANDLAERPVAKTRSSMSHAVKAAAAVRKSCSALPLSAVYIANPGQRQFHIL